MESIKEIYKTGHGPSSSHTMGPRLAATTFLTKIPHASKYKVKLYGSLAATGLGHLTYKTIEEVFKNETLELTGDGNEFLPKHSNAMRFEAFDSKDELLDQWVAYSVGGGSIVDDFTELEAKKIYPLSTMDGILDWCYKNGKHLWEYVEKYEEDDIWDFLMESWQNMKESIHRGLDTDGTLPGRLRLQRKAPAVYLKAKNFKEAIRRRSMIYAYSLAVSEENAAGGKIVTAPTCGACGVMPSVLYFNQKTHKVSDNKIIRAMASAGVIGNLVKTNASISGAEVGCQGEVGTACAMASAALTQLSGGSIFQIEYAAEMGLEHHLGLTCDPVFGLVQIPCIERNAFAAARALNHKDYAMLSDGRHLIGFDEVVEVMKQTGKDLPNLYKETSTGGLALFHGIDERE